jgi:tetratricopeptide (TPR) repeat protein
MTATSSIHNSALPLPLWFGDIQDIWGIKTVTLDHLSSDVLGQQLLSRSLDIGISWRMKAHLRAASHWFCASPDNVDDRERARRYQEAHHHLVELQDWHNAQSILWMPVGNYPLHRQLWRWGDCRTALELLMPLMHRSDPHWDCFLHHEIGQLQIALGHIDAAVQCFEQQIALAETLQLPRALAKGYGGLGQLYGRYLLNVQLASAYYQQQLQMARQCHDFLEEANALSGLGRVEYLKGQFRQSTQRYQQAWMVSQKVLDPEFQEQQRLQLEISYLWRKSISREILLQLLYDAQASGNQHQAWTAAQHLGAAELNNRQWQRAEESLQLAIALAREIQDTQKLGMSLTGLGACYTRMKDWARAIAYTKEAIVEFQRVGDPVSQATCWFNLSYCYSEMNQPFRALRYATDLRRLAQQTDSLYLKGCMYLAVANAQWHRRRWLRGLWLAAIGVFYLGGWSSTTGRMSIAKVLSALGLRKSQ